MFFDLRLSFSIYFQQVLLVSPLREIAHFYFPRGATLPIISLLLFGLFLIEVIVAFSFEELC